ncbi:GAF domain-containing protein [Marivirga harenae]|uniref:GAF domain-containing protein n=1 Tax=Marivirga harenae TaxID=2010992 RepID=UPI0026DF21D0|nr:GAF domain-containing protein [Marivirga harenae]WKV13171.1 GAF domain-containing protein [Marivirga harenae]|tara:strand:+ start:333063 stop:334982 length:1920 start_codon:yes stop_codon:yes gene_type:complete
MKNFRFTIGNKILGGFITLILIFIVYAGITIFTVTQNSNLTQTNSNVIKPSLSSIKDFNLLIVKSKMFVTNWVYLQGNETNKDSLRSIHSEQYPALKEEITALKEKWDNEEQRLEMDTIFTEFEQLMDVQKGIMESLMTFEDYEDPIVKFMASESIDGEVIPQTDSVISHLNIILDEKQKESEQYEAEVLDSSQSLKNTSIILGVVFVILGLIGAFWLASSITRPVNYIKDIIVKLGQGILPEDNERKFGNDEIGEMAVAVGQLVDGLKETSYFAENIGNGKYDSDYQPLSEEDVLGNALINMRGNLRKVAEEDKKRNWTTEGLAMFGDILRKNNDNISLLSDDIISNLVKYTKSNQGGIFVINREDDDDPFLELTACYAWDKKKYLEQKIYEGEGLTGQAWLEAETIYMTEVPQDYVMITSGLGEANPNSILIVPLKVNEEIYGIIELASFNEFAEHEREFVEKIAENIASTISSVKINERTSKLLEESREMTEQMRSQEEEMRQNMEELQATQEEMERGQREREDKEKIINYTNMMVELDKSFYINSINNITSDKLGYSSSDLSGTEITKIIESKDAYKTMKSALEANKTWSGIIQLKHKDGSIVNSQFSCGPLSGQESGGSSYLMIGSIISNDELI